MSMSKITINVPMVGMFPNLLSYLYNSKANPNHFVMGMILASM